MTTVLALTAIEAPFVGNLIPSQFLKPLARANQGRGGERSVHYLALTPWTFYFGRRRPIAHFRAGRENRKRIRRDLAAAGIGVTFFPIPYPFQPRHFNLRMGQAGVFLATALPALALAVFVHRPSLIAARSYPAALLARLAKRLFGIPYVFDLRGMYPEECTNAGSFPLDSADYRWWKAAEKQLIDGARLNVVVSEPFVDHLTSISPGVRAEFIPCCVDTDLIRYDPARKSEARKKYGLEGRFVLLHLGSFGTPGDKSLVARYLKRFRAIEPGAFLVVASGNPRFGPPIRAAFQAEGLGDNDFKILHPAGSELPELLALADIGLLLERKAVNTRVCLSVKLGEYLASGLPVVCTPYVEGAARLLERYGCGIAVDPESDPDLTKERYLIGHLGEMREGGFRLVREVLSLERCARKWDRVLDDDPSDGG